jgi:hypothetical protein
MSVVVSGQAHLVGTNSINELENYLPKSFMTANPAIPDGKI